MTGIQTRLHEQDDPPDPELVGLKREAKPVPPGLDQWIDVDDTLILLNRKATPDGTVLLGWAYADCLHSWTEVVPT